jgi:hypothetical protein
LALSGNGTTYDARRDQILQTPGLLQDGRYILVQDLEENYEELCLKRANGAKAASEHVTRQIDDLGSCVT